MPHKFDIDHHHDLYPRKPWYKRTFSKVGFLLLGVFIVLFVAALISVIRDDMAGTNSNQSVSDDNTKRKTTATDLFTLEDPKGGSVDGKIRIVEFGSFLCPSCKQTYPEIKKLLDAYGDEVYFVYRDFLLQSSLDSLEVKAAEASQCANDQGMFWEMHDWLFENQEQLTEEMLYSIAGELGLDIDLFTECMENRKYQTNVFEDYQDALTVEVYGSPTFFIGKYRIEGATTFDKLSAVIEALLENEDLIE